MIHPEDTPSGAPPPRPGTPPGPSYLAGDIIAQKYRLTRLLGEGGMGAVWLARNLKLDVDVAIKLIRRELSTSETAQRLLQEARAAARIGHRSIVRIFDFGETELEDPFIVMEVLGGESLRDVLERKGRIPATNAVRILLPIASALVEAHASGIVHRDLKPENVMLVPDGAAGMVPKLVDFGIAKLRVSEEGRDDVAGVGLVAGTPAYMSPEQAGGRDEVDEGADVWALAVIFYESITGEVPFDGPSYAALIFAVMTADPTPITDKMAGDAKLWDILQGALAKQPSARPSMRAFGMALAEWAIAQGIESDVAGTSLAAHWTQQTARNPLSIGAPPLPDDAATDLAIPKAPKTGVATLPPPKPRRSHIATRALAAAGLLALAILVVAMSGRSSSAPLDHGGSALSPGNARGSPPDPGSAAALAPSAPQSATVAAPQTEASAAPAEASAAPTAVRPNAKPGGGKPPRKSNLPIARQPNF